MRTAQMNSSMKHLLEAELNPGERLMWSQQPRPLPLVLKTWPLFFFGIPFFSLPVFVIGNLVFPQWHKTEWPMLLFLLSILGLFAVTGLGLILSPLLAWWKAKRTIYAITDQRCFIISAPWRREIHSYIVGQGLGEIENLHRIENAHGQGDVIFHQKALSVLIIRATQRHLLITRYSPYPIPQTCKISLSVTLI